MWISFRAEYLQLPPIIRKVRMPEKYRQIRMIRRGTISINSQKTSGYRGIIRKPPEK